MNFQPFAKIFPIAFIALGATVAQADISVIQPSERGWLCDIVHYPCAVFGQPGAVQANDGAASTNNIFAGSAIVPNDQGQTFNAGVYRNWFHFQIPKFTGTLVSATLTLPEPNRWNTDTRTYSIYSLSGQPGVFADVKSTGVLYGTVTTTVYSLGTIVLLHFNAAGLAAIAAAQGGNLYIGGIDAGETLGGYHGDFSGTGPIGVDFPPYPDLDRRTPLTLNTTPFTNPHTGTCTTPPKSVTSFVIEHPLDVTTIQTTLTPVLAPDTIGLIFSGQREVRSKVTYNAAGNYFNNDIFLVLPGAPLPTPDSFNIPNARFAYVMGLVDTYTNCTPYASVMITGRYLDGVPLLGNPSGAPFAFSFGYNLADPNPNFRFRDLAFISSGLGMTFDAYSYGTIAFPAQTTSPTIVLSPAVSANGVVQVFLNPYGLDASKLTDPGGLPLTYQWSSPSTVSFSPSASSPTPLLTFQSGPGDYPITLTVTNSAGVSSMTSFVLELVKR